MAFLNWLKKPYYFINSTKYNLILSFGVGLFVFLFLFLFEPFGLTSILNNKLLYTGGFGLISFTTMSFFYLVLPYFFKDFFKDENWTVGKNIYFLFFMVLVICFGNFYYNTAVQNTKNFSLLTFKDFFTYTFSLSIFPLIIFTFISEKLYRLHREKNSIEIMKLKKISIHSKNNIDEITLFSNNNKDSIILNLHNLIYITSNKNYVSFYVLTNTVVKEKVLRITLTNVEKKLLQYNYLIRCHKSYIVNSKFMNRISGNARGYFLESNNLKIQIPVSRSFKKEDLTKLIS